MTLKAGSSGPEVKLLQEKLGLAADGKFGPGTEKALKEWQAKNGLTADGIAGATSYRYIEKRLSKRERFFFIY